MTEIYSLWRKIYEVLNIPLLVIWHGNKWSIKGCVSLTYLITPLQLLAEKFEMLLGKWETL